ncbi:MAG: hypothetical protein JWR17_2072 [Pseudomonas sp.]|uniref:hypothetical protein n=1 Tax=Pseudomonas sp. TaxID=306 RepID=UPI002637B8CB|nr:hypothetical protein [Pseudomonas sp.]MDB6049326.1 hypothetical protein [Pseudomonas sp.]
MIDELTRILLEKYDPAKLLSLEAIENVLIPTSLEVEREVIEQVLIHKAASTSHLAMWS